MRFSIDLTSLTFSHVKSKHTHVYAKANRSQILLLTTTPPDGLVSRALTSCLGTKRRWEIWILITTSGLTDHKCDCSRSQRNWYRDLFTTRIHNLSRKKQSKDWRKNNVFVNQRQCIAYLYEKQTEAVLAIEKYHLQLVERALKHKTLINDFLHDIYTYICIYVYVVCVFGDLVFQGSQTWNRVYPVQPSYMFFRFPFDHRRSMSILLLVQIQHLPIYGHTIYIPTKYTA